MTDETRSKLTNAAKSAGRDLLTIGKWLLYPIVLILGIISDAAKRS